MTELILAAVAWLALFVTVMANHFRLLRVEEKAASTELEVLRLMAIADQHDAWISGFRPGYRYTNETDDDGSRWLVMTPEYPDGTTP